MFKTYKKTFFIFFVSIFVISTLVGCSGNPNNIVNTEELGRMMNNNNSKAPDKHEMVKLNNGVVIYRDTTNTQAPSGYSNLGFVPVKPINFGPAEVNFEPKKVNPR